MKVAKRRLSIGLATLLAIVMIPMAALAAGGTFTDDDDSVFEPDIEWLAGAGVTLGCNPPTNDNYCPDGNVSRGQMAAFMRRFAAYLGAEDGIVSEADHAAEADTAITAGSATTADSATVAGDAAMLNGMSSDAFVQHGDIVLTHSTSEVTANVAGAPTTITRTAAGNIISGDGYVMVGLTGPAMLGGVEYGLKSIEYCLQEFGAGALVDRVTVNEEGPHQLGVSDGTDRTVAGCYSMDVNRSGSHGYSVLWTLGGGAGTSLRIVGVTSTWAPAASLPAAVAEASGNPATTGRN